MNSKVVLKKIMSLLSSDEVKLTYAKLADGTIVESPTFDVGEPLEVVSEDGTKTPAPDGEHELSLKDSEGNENLIKVFTEGGVITERENVELEDVEVQPIPQAGNEDKENVMPTQEGSVKMAEETEEVEPLPSDEDKMEEEVKEPSDVEKMAIRIEELEKKIAKMEEALIPELEDEGVDEEEVMEEEELPKLDGAPIEQMKFNAQKNKNNYGKKIENSQSKFLSRLYK